MYMDIHNSFSLRFIMSSHHGVSVSVAFPVGFLFFSFFARITLARFRGIRFPDRGVIINRRPGIDRRVWLLLLFLELNVIIMFSR
jgi:hypothetical protein